MKLTADRFDFNNDVIFEAWIRSKPSQELAFPRTLASCVDGVFSVLISNLSLVPVVLRWGEQVGSVQPLQRPNNVSRIAMAHAPNPPTPISSVSETNASCRNEFNFGPELTN